MAYRIGQTLQPWKLWIFWNDIELSCLRVEYGELAKLRGNELLGLVNKAKQGVLDADILGYVDVCADSSPLGFMSEMNTKCHVCNRKQPIVRLLSATLMELAMKVKDDVFHLHQ